MMWMREALNCVGFAARAGTEDGHSHGRGEEPESSHRHRADRRRVHAGKLTCYRHPTTCYHSVMRSIACYHHPTT